MTPSLPLIADIICELFPGMVWTHDLVLVGQVKWRLRPRDVLENDESPLVPAARHIAHGAAIPLPAAAAQVVHSPGVGVVALRCYLLLSG